MGCTGRLTLIRSTVGGSLANRPFSQIGWLYDCTQVLPNSRLQSFLRSGHNDCSIRQQHDKEHLAQLPFNGVGETNEPERNRLRPKIPASPLRQPVRD
jgi:hypothetical protein